jgi:Kelch motif protein
MPGLIVALLFRALTGAPPPPPTPPTPPSLEWRAGPSLPAPRDHHATFIAGDWLFVAGGNTYASLLSDVWRARLLDDGGLGDWEPATPLPGPRGGHSVAVVGQSVVLTAGQLTDRTNTPGTLVATVGREGRLGPWVPGPPLPAGRFHHSSVAHNGWVYVTGGLEPRTSVANVHGARLDANGVIGNWVDLTPLPAPRSHHASFVYEGALYVVAGLNGNPAGEHQQLRDVLRAPIRDDGSLGAWSEAGHLDSAHATHAAFVRDGWVYVVGGVESNARFVGTVQRAPIREGGMLGFFEPAVPLPVGRGHVHQTPLWKDWVYSVGGSAGRRLVTAVHIGTFKTQAAGS